MKKKAFITIYILIILALLSISISYIYKQTLNNSDINKDIYNKKRAIYKLESYYNIATNDEDALIKYLENINERKKSITKYHLDLKYFEEDDFLLVQKYDDKKFYIDKTLRIGNSKATLESNIDLVGKFELDKKEKLILSDKFEEFRKNLKFKNNKFENYDKLELYKDLLNSNIVCKKNLLIKKDKDNITSSKKIEKINKNKDNSNKNINKTKTVKEINGIVIVDNDLILEDDLEINGLLIIKGDIISVDSKKLTLNGQLISKNDFDIDYNYDRSKAYDFINDIENPNTIKIRSKKVY